MHRTSIAAVLMLLLLAGMIVVAAPASQAEGSGPHAEPAAIRVLSTDRTGITLELTLPEAVLEAVTLDGREYEAIRLPGLVPGVEPGRPDLPRKVVLLGVPPGAGLQVSAQALEVETLPGRHRIAPAPGWVPREAGGTASLEPVYAPDEAVYALETPYPVGLARLVGTGYVRSQRVASLELVPFRYRPASGELQVVRRLQVRLAFDYPAAAARNLGAERAEEASFEAILSRALLNYGPARAWRSTSPAPRGAASPSAASTPWTPPDPGWKVLVNRTGLYRLTYADLEAAGLPVGVGGLDPRTLKVYNGGVEVAIHVSGEDDGHFDEGDTLLFYGQGLDTLYTDTNVYWLAHGGAGGQRMATRDGTPGSAPSPGPFAATARIEENHIYWQNAPGADHWYWAAMRAVSGTHTVSDPLTASFTGTVGVVALDVSTAAVNISLTSSNSSAIYPDHHALVYLNDHLIADLSWDGARLFSTTVEVSQTYLASLTNTFRIDMPADTGADFDNVYVNSFRIDYGGAHRALDDELAFDQEAGGAWSYRVSGFTSADVLALDVSDPSAAVRITGGVALEDYRLYLPLLTRGTGGGGGALGAPGAAPGHYSLRFEDSVAGPASYLVVAAESARQPLAIVPDTPSNLAAAGNQADYVIVAHDDLVTSTLPLSTYWSGQGLAVEQARISDVYDEFSYGVLDPAAIRDFLAHAYNGWQEPRLATVLLVGDATYDPRNFRGFGVPPGIPAYLLPSPYIGETSSDNWYACVQGDDYLPDLHIGRLPARTVAEADWMVDKILDYAQSPPAGTWNEQVLFVADDGGNFAYYSDVVADNHLPSAYTPHKVYYQGPPDDPAEVTAAITGTINSGTLLVNYVGHGAIANWAGENLLMCYGDRCDFDELSNGGMLPFVVSMTCMDGYYIHSDTWWFTSLAERWLLDGDGGGVAAFAATGMGSAAGHDWLNRGLFTALFTDTLALGPATTESKLYLHSVTGDAYRDLVETYHLFGDPALSLNLP